VPLSRLLRSALRANVFVRYHHGGGGSGGSTDGRGVSYRDQGIILVFKGMELQPSSKGSVVILLLLLLLPLLLLLLLLLLPLLLLLLLLTLNPFDRT